MDEILTELNEAVISDMAITSVGRTAAAKLVMDWVLGNCKKDDPTLEAKAQAFSLKVNLLVNSMKIKLTGGKFSISTEGDNGATLLLLKWGSNWFIGNPEIEASLAATLLES